MKKNDFLIVKGWICSYSEIGAFLLKKEDLQNLAWQYVPGQAERLLKYIELKELQLMGKPVFNENGEMLDNHLEPVRLSYFGALHQVAALRFKGYYVRLLHVHGKTFSIELLIPEPLTA